MKQDVDMRAAALEQRRVSKMARSSHAFVRGSTALFYDWLNDLPPLPEGPPVWVCGDCHVGNLGPIADKDGRVDVQIRDLDQTTVGNPSHDLVRLALSLATVARSSDLPGIATARIIEEMIVGYEDGLHALEDERSHREPACVASVRRTALNRKWRHLATERLGDVKPSIPLGKRFWELDSNERWDLGILLDSQTVKSFILKLHGRPEGTKVRLIDSAYWMKGCSSLGRLRYAALVQFSGNRRERKLALIDIKEAAPSLAPHTSGCHIAADHAMRVVEGARALSPHLGQRLASGSIKNRPVNIRELMPEDLKLEMEQFTRAEAAVAARYLAAVVGRAHGRQMKQADRQAWSDELAKRHPKDIAAPSWLWSTVVELLIRHEGAYLEHCRLYGT